MHQGTPNPVFGTDPGRWVAAGVVLLTVLGVLSLLSPGWIFEPTLATGGDLGAHVYPLREFVHRLLPSGALAGWTHGWYGGMPLFYFYFPLPALLVAAFTPLAGFEVAVKLMVALGPLTLPPAMYAFLLGAGLSRWQAVGGAVVGATFLFMDSYAVLGGNLLSTYLGEFTYSISLTCALFYLAAVLKAGRTGQDASLAAAVLLCLTALSHVLTTAFVVMVSLPLLLDRRYGRMVLTSWALGFLLAGFWAFPFLARFSWSGGSVWVHERSWGELLPLELLPLLPFALFGAVRCWPTQRTSTLPLLLMPVAAVGVYTIPQESFHGARLLPFGFLAIHALAGVGIGTALGRAIQTTLRVPKLVAAIGIWTVVALMVARSPWQTQASIEKTSAGYTESETWEAYKEIVDAVSALPPGRLFWEESTGTIEHGTGMAMSIMPYWSPDHPVLGGLWIESSTTHPFLRRITAGIGQGVAPNAEAFAKAIAQARVMGGRYLLAFSDTARSLARAHPQLRTADERSDWGVYEVQDVSLVTAATTQPLVYAGPGFKDVALRWFEGVIGSEPWVVARGPLDWPRVEADLTDLSDGTPLEVAGANITDVEFDVDKISFTTDAIGVPHVVRASFFPNWVGVGAAGPYWAAPSFMVIVPTTEHVELLFLDTWVEWTGRGLTLLGLIVAMFIAAGSTRHRGRHENRGKRAMPSYRRRS